MSQCLQDMSPLQLAEETGFEKTMALLLAAGGKTISNDAIDAK